MDVGQLRDYIGSLESALAKKIQQQKDALEGKLAELQGYVSSKAAGVVRTVMRVPRTGKRAKAKPKYQSKKNESLKWSGRGVTPVWMREEMKGTKLKKDDFLIKIQPGGASRIRRRRALLRGRSLFACID